MKGSMKSRIPPFGWAILTAMWVLCPNARLEAQEFRYDREYPVMGYAHRDPTDRVARL
jgi:hypothetical protein